MHNSRGLSPIIANNKRPPETWSRWAAEISANPPVVSSCSMVAIGKVTRIAGKMMNHHLPSFSTIIIILNHHYQLGISRNHVLAMVINHCFVTCSNHLTITDHHQPSTPTRLPGTPPPSFCRPRTCLAMRRHQLQAPVLFSWREPQLVMDGWGWLMNWTTGGPLQETTKC